MASSVQLCNRALVKLGVAKTDLITALTYEDSPNAAMAVDLYQPAVEELLAEFPWGFATARVQLSRLTTTPPNTDYAYEYELPDDTARVVQTDRKRAKYALYRDAASGYRRLYSNEEVVWADIVQDVDPALYPPHFQRALVAKLRAEFSMPVTRRVDFLQAFSTEAERECARAATQDFNETPWRELDDTNILADARFGC